MRLNRWKRIQSSLSASLNLINLCLTSTGCIWFQKRRALLTVYFHLEISHLAISTLSVSEEWITLLRFYLTTPSYHLSTQDSPHNYLRISRILKCLSEMGLEYFNAGFLLHVLNEQSESHKLNSSRLCNSMDRWWANCIRNEKERLWIRDLIQKVRSAEDGYVFTRQDYEEALQNRAKTGRLALQEDIQEETEAEVVQHSQDNNSLVEWYNSR